MRISYDKDADAIAIWFDGVTSVKTIDVTEDILVDLDKEGRLAGIEVLHASQKANIGDLLSISVEFPNREKVELKLSELVLR